MTKIVILSNFINHHILPLCEEFDKLTNGNFNFVSRKAIAPKRIPLGWKDISDNYDYVIKTYESDEEIKKAYKASLDADYLITGDADDKYILERLRKGKLTFKDSEHIFRSQSKNFSWLRKFRRVYINHGKYMKYPLYLLCSSAYAANDFNKYFAYRGRTYKWGYFPKLIEYDIEELLSRKKKNGITILWVGRFMPLKHPEYIVNLTKELVEKGYQFNVKMIGGGEMFEEIKNKVSANNLQETISLLGPMSPEEVRNHMEDASIFLFTSNHDEGWGVVLNEAMNSGCACVASHAAGSTGFLIKHNINGLVYKSEDYSDLLNNVTKYLDDELYRDDICKNAYKTILEDFNARIAAERFVRLANCLKEGKDTPYDSGLCSKAYPINEEEMFEYLVKNHENSNN